MANNRIEEYLEAILAKLYAGTETQLPVPSWNIEKYLAAIYEASNGVINPEDLADVVTAYFTAHPEAALQDGSVNKEKLNAELQNLVSNTAINGKESVDITDYDATSCTISASNTITRSGTKYKSRNVTRNPLWKSIAVTANDTTGCYVVFLTEALPAAPTSGESITSILASGETGRHGIAKKTTEILTIPSDAAIILIAEKSNNNDATPSSVIAYTEMGGEVAKIPGKLDSTADHVLNWVSTFGSEDVPLGWTTGYYNATGGKGTSTEAIITRNKCDYIAKNGERSIQFDTPSGTYAAIIEYDQNGANGKRYGDYNAGSNSVKCTCTEGYRYRFMVSGLTNSGDYITAEFLATVTATVAREIVAWNEEQDERLLALEQGEDGLPAYYTSDGYLQGKVDTITEIGNTIGTAQDAFFFITDYHHQYNEGNSLAMLNYISKRTGIKKVFFGGDAGGSYGSSESAVYHRLQASAKVWDDLSDAVGECYGVLGNHEWIVASVANPSAMIANYLGRYKTKVDGMDADTGNYYVDNPVNKIRYFFLQDDNHSKPVDGTMPWFGQQLLSVPADYSVAVVVHFAYIPSAATEAEYDDATITYSYTAIKGMSQMLAAMRDKQSLTYSDETYDFSALTGDRHVIGIFSGHIHHGFLYTESEETGIENIAVFRGSTDCMHAETVSVDGAPWYWADGEVGGTKIVREAGKTSEQCFYVVQIDMTNHKLYITAIGGDHDWAGFYEPSTENE